MSLLFFLLCFSIAFGGNHSIQEIYNSYGRVCKREFFESFIEKSLLPYRKMEHKGSKKIKGLNRQNSISAPPSPIKRQGSSFDKLFEETKGSFEIIEEEYEDDVDDQQQHLIAPKSPKKILFSSYCKFFFLIRIYTFKVPRYM